MTAERGTLHDESDDQPVNKRIMEDGAAAAAAPPSGQDAEAVPHAASSTATTEGSHDDSSTALVEEAAVAAAAAVMRLRGLPFSAGEEEVRAFLAPLELAPLAIHIITNGRGQKTGQCMVELQSEADAETALGKHRASMGSRYVEVFRSR